MFRLLRQQRTNVTYSELAEKEHWWWDTFKTNDGGVVNDPVIRKFAVSHAQNAGKVSTGTSKTNNNTVIFLEAFEWDGGQLKYASYN